MREITQDDWDEMTKLREPTVSELVFLASMAGHSVYELDCRVYKQHTVVQWDPLNKLDQNLTLLGAVISKGDCKLFYDDGVNEFFIYQYISGPETEPPIAHRTNLNEAVIEAAMNLWIPEEE